MSTNVFKALAKAKVNLGPVTKAEDNPFFKSKYADLNAHLELVEPELQKVGLTLIQPVTAEPGTGRNQVNTILIHNESGETVTLSSFTLPEMTDPQKIGAAVTYFRRFAINSAFSLRSEDDDGETAAGRGKTKETKPTSNGKLDSKSSFSNGTTKAF